MNSLVMQRASLISFQIRALVKSRWYTSTWISYKRTRGVELCPCKQRYKLLTYNPERTRTTNKKGGMGNKTVVLPIAHWLINNEIAFYIFFSLQYSRRSYLSLVDRTWPQPPLSWPWLMLSNEKLYNFLFKVTYANLEPRVILAPCQRYGDKELLTKRRAEWN